MPVFRGATGGSAAAAGARTIALPVGTVAGDWAILALASAGTGEVWTWPAGWTEILQDTFGTAKAGIAVGKVTSADITAGTITYTQAAAGSTRYALVIYGDTAGFGVPGAAAKRTSSSTAITAPSVPLTPGQWAAVIRLEKSTSNPGPATAAPATTLRAETYSNAAAAPSVWVGDTDTAGARTFTDPVASGNGLGIQVLILAAAPAGSPTVSVWDGTTEITGCVMSIWDGTAEVPISGDIALSP